MNDEFKNLINESEEWVKLSKRRGYDFDSILAGLYNDPSHFIYEMLQNAEDEKATYVRFELFENKLDIYHDGKPFDFEDIKGVTGIGISTKKGKPDAIGKFGVGFKSVFAITETPVIFSGEYKIRINDFVVTDALLARGEELTDFLSNEDIESLFGKKNWLDTAITENKTKELRDYLIRELNIEEVDFESFARKITSSFLQEKPDRKDMISS